jgi:hypothetical protein
MFKHKVKDYEVIFDSEEDFFLVTQFEKKIPDIMNPRTRKIWVDDSTSKPYAMISYKGKNLRLHHIILGYPLDKMMIDHFNGNSLDNRRENLRVVSRSMNQYNRKAGGNRGISKQKNGKFTVVFRKSLGTFESLDEAENVLNEYRKKLGIQIYKDFL